MDGIISIVKDLYGLDLALIGKIAGGYLSDNFELASGSAKYFLKKHRTKAKEVVLVEKFFAEGGVPVILPVPTKEGALYFEYAKATYSLYPFVEGRHIERGTLGIAAARSLGETLGRLHARGKGSTVSAPDNFRPWGKEKFLRRVSEIEAAIAQEQPITEFDALALKNLALKKEVVLANTVTYDDLGLGTADLIHGDYFCDNVFFGVDDQVTHVFDFEKAQYASAPYEMFRSLVVSFFSVPSEENLFIAKEYVHAYLAQCQTSEDTLKKAWTVLLLKQANSVWAEEEHYIKHNSRPDDLLPSQYDCNRYIFGNPEEILQTLLH